MMGCAMTLPDVAPASSSQDELETSHPANTPSSVGLTFFDLPQEIRDQIFLRHPKRAWIDLAQVPEEAMQPNASKVSRRMRVETLDVFYGKKVFFLDFRGWKSSALPKKWTPLEIFSRWITAIGDDNAGRLRSLSFYSHNFNANVRIRKEAPRIILRFRPFNLSSVGFAEHVPNDYTPAYAGARAAAGLQFEVDAIERRAGGGPFSVADLLRVFACVEAIQPFLCRRNNLGYKGAVFPMRPLDEAPERWPNTEAHRENCDDCGYHRYTRGSD